MKYRIKHITEYIYAARVSHCYNMAHLIPRTTRRQKCLSAQINVSPNTSYSSKREDYFGNTAYHFEIQRPHKKLIITASSDVTTDVQSSGIDLDLGISYTAAKQIIATSRAPEALAAREFMLDSTMVSAIPALRDYAASSFESERPLLSSVKELTERIYTDFTYCPESTTIATPLEEVLEKKRGVCQDFAHLQIACLRALGIPAKYVSGYLETLPPPGKEKLVGADASHAWVSVYSPSEGWFEFDPTNNCLAGEQHIITAWGRDYFDVTPLRGVIYGGGERPLLNISVDVARLR